MGRYALVRESDDKVANVVEWDGVPYSEEKDSEGNVISATGWQPPVEHYAVESDTAKVGDIYDLNTNSFSTPEE